jgi:hypothetical protein
MPTLIIIIRIDRDPFTYWDGSFRQSFILIILILEVFPQNSFSSNKSSISISYLCLTSIILQPLPFQTMNLSTFTSSASKIANSLGSSSSNPSATTSPGLHHTTSTTTPTMEDRIDGVEYQLSSLQDTMDQIMDMLKQQSWSTNPSTPVGTGNLGTSSGSGTNTPGATSAAAPTPSSTNSRFVAEASGKSYDFLGLDDFLATPRSSLDIKVTGINALSGRERMDLDLMEQTKICKEAVRGLHPDKFKIIDKLAGLEQLVSIDNLVRLEELIDKLHKFMGLHGMLNVFYVLEFNSLDQPLPMSQNTKCIFLDYHNITLLEVQQTVNYFLQYGREYHHQNLKWSYDTILNSCTLDLRELLIGKMALFSDSHKVGPILFMVLIRQLTNVSPEAIRVVTNKLATLSMADFEGESVLLVNKAILCTVKWLQMLNRPPHDLEVIVMRIYRTTSIPSFRNRLEAIRTTHMSYHPATGYKTSINSETLLDMCAQYYEECILEGSWDHGASSSFKARSIPPAFLPPREGETESKDINGKPYKYCKICRRWITGNKMHDTPHHVPREGLPLPPTTSTTASSTSSAPASLPRNDAFRRVNFSSGI